MGIIVFISFDAAIDMQVDRNQHTERLILIFDFNLLGLTLVVEQLDTFSNQRHRGFIKPSVEGDAAVFIDLSAGYLAKVVMQVRGAITRCGEETPR